MTVVYVGAVVFVVPQHICGEAQRISILISPVSFKSKTGVDNEPMNPKKLLITIGRLVSKLLLVVLPSTAATAPTGLSLAEVSLL